MDKIIKYRIVYYAPGTKLGSPKHLAWCEEQKRFIPQELRLYTTSYDSLDEVFKAIRKVKKACTGWYDDIYIDSYISSVEF